MRFYVPGGIRGTSARRLAISLALAAASLPAAATIALADGGPHQLAQNNGTLTLAGDCAACHRAHTATGADLLKSTMPALCLSCHDGTAATTDVVDGYQFVPNGSGSPTSTILGALRGGGFSFALIDSSNAARLIGSTRPTGFLGHVGVLPVAAKEPATSSHGGLGTVWGNGSDGTTGGGATGVVLTCGSCHNPHGNGQYRILQTKPGEDWANGTGGVLGWTAPGNAVELQDGVTLLAGEVRNYTVLPGNITADVISVGYTPTQGDYWRKNSPWNLRAGSPDPLQVGWDGASPTNAAANAGDPPVNGTGLMTAWCIACHTRYSGLVNADGISSSVAPQPDAIFTYRHLTMNYGCEQCHVSHGSNALMTTNAELDLRDPSGALPVTIPSAGPAGSPVTSGDSRLLKVDDRGTCQLCHDPTGSVKLNDYVGPVPTPGVP
jgi:predicted CXXCH cytochrome family protein